MTYFMDDLKDESTRSSVLKFTIHVATQYVPISQSAPVAYLHEINSLIATQPATFLVLLWRLLIIILFNKPSNNPPT